MVQVSSKLDALAYVFAPLLLEGHPAFASEDVLVADRGLCS